MTPEDAKSVVQLALRIGLISEAHMTEVWDELDPASTAPEAVLQLLERRGYITPWHSSKLIRGDTDGYILGGYKLLYKVASGSFGRVFRAEDPRDGSVVALKVLRRRWCEDSRKVEMFEREGRLGMSMHHPNIVSILSVGRDAASSQYFIVMEFVEGGNLKDFLHVRKRLEVPEALRLIEECAAALAYANMRGLTHRDLKPTNVLISAQGTAKLVDFGLAAIAAPLPGEDHEMAVDRTVDYAGLEKATSVKHGDPRSDIYFLGTIFYEMLTGHPALLQTRDKVARMNRHRFDSITPVAQYGVKLPASVNALLNRMISYDPAGRYQSPAQLHEAVRKVQAEMDGVALQKQAPAGPKSLFVVEAKEKLKDVFREKFTEAGFRVLMANDPERAVKRYEEQPYHAVIIDAGTAGETGVKTFRKLFADADNSDLSLAGVLILNEEQAVWAEQVPQRPDSAVLVRPVNLRQLLDTMGELLSKANEPAQAAKS